MLPGDSLDQVDLHQAIIFADVGHFGFQIFDKEKRVSCVRVGVQTLNEEKSAGMGDEKIFACFCW